MMLGRHIGRGKIWHNVHFGCMLEAMATGTAAFYLPRMPETARQRLTRDLGLLPPPTSMREVVLHYEENAFDWAIDNFERAEKEGRLLELVASISGKENAKKALELAHDADGMIKLARAGRQLRINSLMRCLFARTSTTVYSKSDLPTSSKPIPLSSCWARTTNQLAMRKQRLIAAWHFSRQLSMCLATASPL